MEQADGKLTKLIIESYADEKYSDKAGEDFKVMFNPNKYTLHYEIEYGKRQIQGTSADAPSFSNMKSQELTLEFFIDGTGVSETGKIDVQDKVDDFLEKAYRYDGKIHRNRYLRIIWSSLVFDCVLLSADVNYNLFDSSGKPLRAKINAKFKGYVSDQLRVKKEDANSPDLSHLRTVLGRDRIDRMTHYIYKTSDYYIDVATANRLFNFRKLKAGTQLVFPPVKQEDKQ